MITPPWRMTRYEFIDSTGTKAWCELHLYYLDDGRVLVIVSERPDNPGMHIAHAAVELAYAVIHSFKLTMQQIVWLEHDRGRFDFVVFRGRPGVLFQVTRYEPSQLDWDELGLLPPNQSASECEKAD